MFIGKVRGAVVATQKEPRMRDAKMLLVEALTAVADDPRGLRSSGKMLVALDSLGAGEGEYVLVTQGSSARMTEMTKTMPVDAVVIGIIDAVTIGSHVLSRTSGTLNT